MVNWQITLTTIHCEAVNDEVTLMVYKDGSARCSGVKVYGRTSAAAGKSGKKTPGAPGACTGAGCRRLAEYKAKLFAAEGSGGK